MRIDMDKIYALMTSADFRARFKAEYWQLKDRYEKLNAMIAKYEAGKLDFEPLCPLGILKEQRSLMLGLMYVLQRRAAIENVELNEDDVTLTEEPTKDLQEGELVAVSVPGGCQIGIVRELYQDGADILFAGTDNMQYYISYMHICKVTNNEYISVTEAPTEQPSEDNADADAPSETETDTPFRKGELVAIHSGALYHVGLIRSISSNDKCAWVTLCKGSIERCSDPVAHYYALSELHHIANSDAIRMV